MENIKDSFHRTIDYIRISVTDHCNFRCTYCMPRNSVPFLNREEILTYEELERLCHIFASIGIRKVKLTGGEPLARKDIVSFVRKISHIEGIEQVTLTTNGSMLADYALELKEAGIAGINISIDTLRRETFQKLTGTDQLSNVLEAIKEVQKVKISPIKINCVPLRGVNEEDLCKLASYAKDSEIAVRFIEMMPIGRGEESLGLPEEEVRNILEAEYGILHPVHKKLGNGPASYFRPDGFTGYIGFISAISHQFCSQCNRIRLTADGMLKACLQYSGHLSLRELLRTGKSDEEIQEAIMKVISEKPLGHQFQNASASNKMDVSSELEDRMMSNIGG